MLKTKVLSILGYVKVPKKRWAVPEENLPEFFRALDRYMATSNNQDSYAYYQVWKLLHAVIPEVAHTTPLHWHRSGVRVWLREGKSADWGRGYTWVHKSKLKGDVDA